MQPNNLVCLSITVVQGAHLPLLPFPPGDPRRSPGGLLPLGGDLHARQELAAVLLPEVVVAELGADRCRPRLVGHHDCSLDRSDRQAGRVVAVRRTTAAHAMSTPGVGGGQAQNKRRETAALQPRYLIIPTTRKETWGRVGEFLLLGTDYTDEAPTVGQRKPIRTTYLCTTDQTESTTQKQPWYVC